MPKKVVMSPPVKSLSKGSSMSNLVTQIIDLVKTNQSIINEVIKDNTEMRSQITDLIKELRKLISMIEAASDTESSDELNKIIEQNQKLIEGNQALIERLDTLNRKIRAGTPVSQLLSSYPKLKLRRGTK